MKKNRYLLSILLAALMLYFAFPKLTFDYQSQEGLFSITWIGFCALVIVGNISGILLAPKNAQVKTRKQQMPRKRVRSN